MSAQLGNAVVLDYGLQGSQQIGNAVVLDYSPIVIPTSVPVSSSTSVRWAQSAAVHRDVSVVAPASVARDAGRTAAWTRLAALQRTTQAAWSAPKVADRGVNAYWVRREQVRDNTTGVQWGRTSAADRSRTAPWSKYARHVAPDIATPWPGSKSQERNASTPWGVGVALQVGDRVAPWPGSRHVGLDQWSPWARYSRTVGPGWGIPSPDGDTPGPDGETIVVPVKRVYVVINTSSLTRLSDGRVIPMLTATASLDVDSWVWSFSASVPVDQLAYLQDPEDLLQVSVNGTPFTFMPERLSRTRTFGQASISVQGRGRQAVLDSPYSAVQTFTNASARTANQLVEDVLTVNGTPMGTAVAWNLTDWLVPAGAFTHQGSYISVVNAIAASAGGYVQPENVADGLRILHRYPTAPWEWAGVTPDLILPADVVVQESIEWTNRTQYNRVFVSGTSVGVLGQVTRTGTDGSLAAPMVTDQLITHADAALQRGRAILGATGRAATVNLNLPVLSQTGVIRPGTFVQYNDGTVDRIGLSRSVSVALDGAETWQTIGVETYDEPV